MKIILEKHNDNWKYLFKDIAFKIRNKIKQENISIEHIGSTSVQGLKSKPIIDILIGVSEKLDNYINPITSLGFKHIKEYEKELPNRRFFLLENRFKKIAHIHLVNIDSKWFRRHIAFRDELRSNKIIRQKYENLKSQLSTKQWENGNEYSDAKTKFIRSIERDIGVS